MYFLLCTPLFRWQGSNEVISSGQGCVKALWLDSLWSPLCVFILHFYSLSTPSTVHFYTLPPPPIFTVWTCTDCGQQSIWDNGDCQCNVWHLERERERITAKRKDTFSPVVGVEKVISVVMYSCFGNIRFLAERQTKRNYKKRRRRLWRWWKDNETSRFGWSDLPWHSWQILDCSGTPSPRARKRTGH